MEFLVPCDLKINLTLRITDRRPSGFHDLCSLFMSRKGPETLTLTPLTGDNVRDSIFVHNETILGENILDLAAAALRNSGLAIPPLELHVWKQIPPGSGLGGGSGNAASFVRWVEAYTGSSVQDEILARLGADVPFLYRTNRLSLVTGIGDIQEDIRRDLTCQTLVLFPTWTSPTPQAYRDLDAHYGSGGWPRSPVQAAEEAHEILHGLRQGKRIGLLPNDFLPVLTEKFPDYETFFAAAEASGAQGYGITGSGSACFALFDRFTDIKDLYRASRNWTWVNKILVLE